MDPVLLNTALIAGFGVITFGVGFLIGRYTLKGLVADVETLKNFHFQLPVSVTPVVATPVATVTN